jgi:hypothetical protein
VLAVEKAAGYHRQQARLALLRGQVNEAHRHALNACTLYRSPKSVEVLALVALADQDFATALTLWREYRRG